MNTLEFLSEHYGKRLGIELTGDPVIDAINIMTGSNYTPNDKKKVLNTGKLIIRASGVLSSTKMNIEGIKTVPLKKGDPDWIWTGEPAIYIFLDSQKTFNYQNLAITYDPRHVAIAMTKGIKIENWSNKK